MPSRRGRITSAKGGSATTARSEPSRSNCVGSMAATAVAQEMPVAPSGVAGHDGPAGAPRREWGGQWFMPPAISLEHGVSAVRAFAEAGWRITTGLANVREAGVRKAEA